MTDYRHNESGSVNSPTAEDGEAESTVAERSTATSPPQDQASAPSTSAPEGTADGTRADTETVSPAAGPTKPAKAPVATSNRKSKNGRARPTAPAAAEAPAPGDTPVTATVQANGTKRGAAEEAATQPEQPVAEPSVPAEDDETTEAAAPADAPAETAASTAAKPARKAVKERAGKAQAEGGRAGKRQTASPAERTRADKGATQPDQARSRRDEEKTAQAPKPLELHSGHRLAKRYRLEECITRLDGFSSWRAVDEKLRRAVGVHVLPAGHERASAVLSAARATALLGDPRFVQVLDAVEENQQVYVVHEWLTDATPLSTVLAAGPLDPYEAQAMATQVAQAMAAAHRKDLAHLRLSPATVLRTGPAQFRIRGLAVDAALRGITASNPRRTDTEAIGALLYASLTQRWPYPEGAHGLQGVAGLSKGSRTFLATPEQVRAGVHRGLSELAMRALVNEGATAASQKPPYTTPEELAEALAAMPRIPPSAPTPTSLAGFQPTTYQRGTLGPGRPAAPVRAPAAAAPALPGRTGAVLKWGVSALLIAALGLGSWQLADALLKGEGGKPAAQTSLSPEPSQSPSRETGPITVQDSIEFDPESTLGGQNPELAGNVIDGDPDTDWHTKSFFGPHFGNYRTGMGIILDLGETQEVGSVTVNAIGDTPMELRAAPADATEPPSSPDDFTVLTSGSGETVTLSTDEPVETRFLLVWLTDLPQTDDGKYRGRITDITVSH